MQEIDKKKSRNFLLEFDTKNIQIRTFERFFAKNMECEKTFFCAQKCANFRTKISQKKLNFAKKHIGFFCKFLREIFEKILRNWIFSQYCFLQKIAQRFVFGYFLYRTR